MNLFVCLVQGMSKQAGTNRAPTDSLGWGPTRPREVLVQLQPRGGQGWGAGEWQLEMGSVHSRVPTLTWGLRCGHRRLRPAAIFGASLGSVTYRALPTLDMDQTGSKAGACGKGCAQWGQE